MTKANDLNILLIDDEADFASTLAERLHLRGFSAAVALDGASALARLGELSFDLVILDNLLPDIQGIDLLGRIREIAPDLPVVMLSGQARGADADIAMRQGANAYLTKPVDLQELLKLFTTLIPGGGRA